MNTNQDWARARSVLAIRLDALGDVLMTSPALRALKQAQPGRKVALLSSPAGAAAGSLIPEVDEVLVHEAPWVKATPPRLNSRPDVGLLKRLSRRKFDAAV